MFINARCGLLDGNAYSAEAKQALSDMNVGSVLQVLASDPETLHDIPLMLGRTPHELLSVESNEGEYVFLIEVKENE